MLDAQMSCELAHVLERFDAPCEIDHRPRLLSIEAAPGRALPELVLELVIAHGICGAALAKIRSAFHNGAVVELNFDDRCHLVEAGGLGFRVDAEVHPLQQRLHVGAIDHLVGELPETGLALEEQDRHAEFHAELGLQLVTGAMMDERIWHIVIGADRYPFDPLRSQIMTMDEIEHDTRARMRERPAGMRLDRDTGEGEGPWIAELAVDHAGAIAPTRGPKKSPVGLQSVRRCSKTERRHLGGDYAAFGGASRMKRLGHGAEVFAQSGGLRGAQAQCAARGFAIEAEQLRGACGGADRATGRGAVKAVLIVARQDRPGHLAFDPDPDLIPGNQLTGALPIPLRKRT